jgi:hypothetical protein
MRRLPRLLPLFATLCVITACGPRRAVTVTDGGASPDNDAGMVIPDAGFVTAEHSWEYVPNNGGPVLSAPIFVTITYADFVQRKRMEDFADYLVTSPWLATVGPEYGIGPGTSVHVELPMSAPTTIQDTEIQQNIAGWIADGTVPSGVDAQGVSQYVYMMYFPPSTTVQEDGGSLCDFSAGGYHSSDAARTFSYGVVSPCPDSMSRATIEVALDQDASHEFIEAVTDPYPTTPAFTILDMRDPWGSIGGEVGDLCAFLPPQTADGYSPTRVFSNASAAAGKNPCLPASVPFYGLSAESNLMQSVSVGHSITIPLKAWSTEAVPEWFVYAQVFGGPYGYYAFKPDVLLDAQAANNGDDVTLTVTVPADTRHHSGAFIYISSYRTMDDYTDLVLGVQVP